MIQAYFHAEKRAAFLALSIGLAACTVASAFLISARPPFYTGLALGLMALGIVEIIVGTTVARRSDLQAMEMEKLLANAPAEFVQTELQRMEKVLLQFSRYKWAEAIMILFGLLLIYLNNEPVFSKGLGAGLFGQGAIMLVFDYFAEKRAKKYNTYIQGIRT